MQNRRHGSLFFKPAAPKVVDAARPRWAILRTIGKIVRRMALTLGSLMLISMTMSCVAGYLLVGGEKTETLPGAMTLHYALKNPVTENASMPSLSDPFAMQGLTISELVKTLDMAKDDPRVKGLMVSMQGGRMELSHIQELREALKRFKAAGKKTVIYASSYADSGSGMGTYYLASAFDEIWMQPIGAVMIGGISIEMPFARDLLDKVGVKPEFLHREEYKSAMESLTHNAITEPNREMMQSILDDLSDQIKSDIARDKKMTPQALQSLIDRGLFTGDEALKYGLLTQVDYNDVLIDNIEKGDETTKIPASEFVMLEEYYDANVQKPDDVHTSMVAQVSVVGEIVDGDEFEPGYATGGYIAAAIDDAREDKNVKVIVVRVDSPGGSPSASETIRRAIVRAKEAGKIVIVSMGSMAASGGYWVSVDADKIYALPSTLTGSIGVIMGKFTLVGLWEKLGVNWSKMQWGENSGLWSPNESLNDRQRAVLDAAIDDTYDAFLSRVATGRKMDKDAVHKIAKGRAWTGAQAIKIGLVDQIGGLDAALDDAAKRVGITDHTKLRVKIYPKPESELQQILTMLGLQTKPEKVMGQAILPKPLQNLVRESEVMERMGPVQAYAPMSVH